jgi:hypothetical protein
MVHQEIVRLCSRRVPIAFDLVAFIRGIMATLGELELALTFDLPLDRSGKSTCLVLQFLADEHEIPVTRPQGVLPHYEDSVRVANEIARLVG